MTKYYNIDWSKVKTIKDIKSILSILAMKVVINHDDPKDVKIFEDLESMLVETTEEDN